MNAEPANPERDPSTLDDPRNLMSAFADGDGDGDAAGAERAAALWREDGQAREAWYTYHLIGDVLRSDDLASEPRRDAAFVAALRRRLAAEPVPIASRLPPAPALESRRLGWRAPAAIAAGIAAVSAVVMLARPDGLFNPPAAELARATGAVGARPVLASTATPQAPAPGSSTVTDGRVIRDARLDAYLRAHQAARGGAPAALPGGAVRSVEMLLPPAAQALPQAGAPR